MGNTDGKLQRTAVGPRSAAAADRRRDEIHLADSLALHVVTLPPGEWLDTAAAMVASYRRLIDRDFRQLPSAARTQSATNFATALLARIAALAEETGGAVGEA